MVKLEISLDDLREEIESQQPQTSTNNTVTFNDLATIYEKIGLVFPGWKITEDDPNNIIKHRNIQLVAEPPEQKVCPSCLQDQDVYKHGVRETLFLDIPRINYQVGLLVKRQRLRCLKCQKAFLPSFDELDTKRKMTRRLIEWIEERAKRYTYAEVARECGVSAKQVREIWLQKHPITINQMPDRPAPEFLGIDEVYVGLKYRCVLTDLKERKVYDVLDDRLRDSVQTYFKRLKNRDAIRFVCIDMHGQYKDAIRNAGLTAKIVVDKFHVISLAIRALDKVRIRLQKDIKNDKSRKALQRLGKVILRQRRHKVDEAGSKILYLWLKDSSDLKTAYWLKEGVIKLYDFSTREKATTHLEEWMASIPPYLTEFQALKQTYREWRETILNYFDICELPNGANINNGFTEQVNRQIKAINSRGRGYRFEYLREKVLQGEFGAKIERDGGHRKEFRKVVEKEDKKKENKESVVAEGAEQEKTPKKRGAKPYVEREIKDLYKLSSEVAHLEEIDMETVEREFDYDKQIEFLVNHSKEVEEAENAHLSEVMREQMEEMRALKQVNQYFKKNAGNEAQLQFDFSVSLSSAPDVTNVDNGYAGNNS